jgi:TonB-dependent SusC/RagA subfamily outer membrane receptor
MKKIVLLFFLLAIAAHLWAQERTITGKVTSSEDGSTLPGVNVLLKGTSNGTITDASGNFSLSGVPTSGGSLIFSFVGLQTMEVVIGDRTTIDISLSLDVTQLSEVVVTALGIDRQKASLGYATQEVGGSEVTAVRDVNFMNTLSGKVAGVAIKRSNQMGGSTNVVIRGYKSLTGNNQALFVVDGIILGNDINNTANQQTGRGGFDYGNAAMDINPDDIETINVLKGAAATALYGSRAANGVVVITTKKGMKRKGLGVTASFGTTFGSIDKSTFLKYQNQYGPGYSAYQGWYGSDYTSDPDGLEYFDFGNGPVLITPTYEDASYGGTFDPNLQVADWRSLYPELSTYGQLFPFVGAKNDASTFFETSRIFL